MQGKPLKIALFFTGMILILHSGCIRDTGLESGPGDSHVQMIKTTNGTNNDASPGLKLIAGEHVVWTYEITNIGDAPLKNIKVTDDIEGDIGFINSMDVDETRILTHSGWARLGQYVNIGKVTVDAENRSTADDADPEYYTGVITGTWEAVKESVFVPNIGKITVTPLSSMFMHLSASLYEDHTFTYEMWTGTDKTAAYAGYQTGTGQWSIRNSVFTLHFMGDEPMTIRGKYQLAENALTINTKMVIDILGDDPADVEITLILNEASDYSLL